MRAVLLTSVFFIFGTLAGNPQDPTAYSIDTVRSALRMQSGDRKVILSVTQKRIARMGDAVSIALLKILDPQDLADPRTVADFLPIIREAFDQPQLISVDVDKQPKITLFLLNHLQQEISDPQTQQAIQQTIQFVKARTAK